MIWRVLASMAIQIHCLLAFFCTKLHIASASASSRRSTTSVGRYGSRTCTSSGQAAKHSTSLPTLHEVEAALRAAALQHTDGNPGVAAGLLGVARQTLP